MSQGIDLLERALEALGLNVFIVEVDKPRGDCTNCGGRGLTLEPTRCLDCWGTGDLNGRVSEGG